MCNKTINVRFCWKNNQSKTSKSLFVFAGYAGETNGKFRAIASFGKGELIEPCEKLWINKKGLANQRFKKNAPHAETNNAILSAINLACDTALASNPETIESFWALVIPEKNAGKHDAQTLGGFIESYIKELKSGNNQKLASANHQVFTTLLHHLEREDKSEHSKHIIAQKINKISNKDFKAFGEYLSSLNQRNYNQIMSYFKRIHNVACKRGIAKEALTYDYREHQPKIIAEMQIKQSAKVIATLTKEQITKLENLDINKIALSGVNPDFYKQLYKDTALLMYYLYSRPIDIFSLKSDSVKGDYIDYVPCKKKNNRKAQRNHTQCPINEKALAIIERYKGMSKGGYVLPFSENEKGWENIYFDAQEYRQRYNKCNNMLYKVNSFLHKVAKELNITFENDTFTLYVMRHSAITHAISNGNPTMLVAKVAGTSVKEIENSYYDHTQDMYKLK